MARPMSARPAAASAPPALAATGAAPPPPAAAEAPAAFPGLAARPAAGFWVASLRRFLRNRFALSALGALLLLVALSFAAPLIGRALGVDRDAIELLDNYQPPSARHWLGTDEYGRDYFIRLLYGGQVSILMGLGVAAIILAIGVPLGILAGYYGGALDDLFNWIVQILISVPRIPLYILVAAWLPPTPPSLALLLGSLAWPGNARQARGLTFSLKRTDYVLAARALGATDRRIMFRHILPNLFSLMIVLAGFDVIVGVFAEVTLSFLGFGIRPPVPSWGNMLTNSLTYMFKAPYLVIFPGLAIGLLVLCVYTLADGLRDAFDPRLAE
jgi:peptide/nickel transport system permease protein